MLTVVVLVLFAPHTGSSDIMDALHERFKEHLTVPLVALMADELGECGCGCSMIGLRHFTAGAYMLVPTIPAAAGLRSKPWHAKVSNFTGSIQQQQQ